MASATRGDGPSDVPGTSTQKAGLQTSPHRRSTQAPSPSSDPALENQPTTPTNTTTTTTTKRSSLLKPKSGGHGYDFSGSFDQTRRVRFKFGGHSLAVEATLAKLFESLTVECSGVLVQPQWKHFRHFDMLKNDQIRLSNGIWRSWHIKYQKGLEPLFCTFDLNTNLNDHTRPEAVVLEGKYHNRKVEAVANEYRKWRMFHREKFRQGGCKPDPLLADLLEHALGDDLGGGSAAETQVMQVEPPMPDFIQLEELTDPFLMGLGPDYYSEYNASSNMMFQPKMDVLSSALDELWGKLEPMEVLLSRTGNSSYQSPLAMPPVIPGTYPPSSSTTPPVHPAHHIGVQQQMLSPQMTPTLSPHTHTHQSHITPPPMAGGSLTNFMGDNSNSLFSAYSPFPTSPSTSQSYPSPSYLSPQQPQEQRIYDDSNDVTPTHTPPPRTPENQFSMPPGVLGGAPGMGLQQQPSMFQLPLKRDTSSESVQSPQGEYRSPPSGGSNPAHIHPMTNSDYNPSIISNGSQSNYNNVMLSSGQPMSGVAMDTRQQTSLLSQQLPTESQPPLQRSMGGSLGNIPPHTQYQQMSYETRAAPVVAGFSSGEGGGGGIVGSKRKEGSLQFLPGAPGTKRRSPFNSQSDLPLWSEAMPPPSAPLSTRRASIGSSVLPSEKPVLEKNKSEPPGSLLLKEQIKLLAQQHEQHSQELDKQQSLAQQQYHDALQQYKMIAGQEQLTEADRQLLHTVLSKPALVEILRTLLSPSSASTSPSFTQPTPSPLLHTPSPTPPSSHPAPPSHSPLSLITSGGENDSQMQNECFPSPTENARVTEFQSRLLVAAAVQASGGNHTHPSALPTNTLAASTPAASSFSSGPDLLSPTGVSRQLSGGSAAAMAAQMKLKSSRGLSFEQKEVYKEIRRQSHISAEQKRRGTIKQGFDQLQSLVIDPSSYPSGKVSKAAVLEKTVEFIEHAHREREQRERQMQALRKEQEELNAAITKCQENLPASGVPVTRQRFEENRRRFQEYVQQRTLQNYKFWIYSIILQQLFDSYNSTVSTGNQDELCRTVLAWFEQNCSLHALRPVVMNSLKELSTKTSILSEPSQVPQQLVQYAKEQLKASQDFNS